MTQIEKQYLADWSHPLFFHWSAYARLEAKNGRTPKSFRNWLEVQS